MRICHVSDCYAPRTGGIESQVRDLAREQARAGHDVHVLTATLGPHGERGGIVEDDGGVQVHRLGARLPFELPVNPAAVPRMRSVLRGLAPDVVHVHAGVVSPFAYDGARLAVGEGLPVAITWHCMLDGVVPALRVLAGRRWRGVALSAVSEAAADRVRTAFGGAPVGIVPNGMDLDAWRPDGAPGPRGGDGALRCVATMRLAPRKRGLALLGVVEDALAQLEPGALTLEVLGDGPQRGAMVRRIARRGLQDAVTLRGRVPRDAVRATYAGADVFVAPAVLEAFGVAALEARAAGLVVVARAGTGIAEFVTDGVDGLLVDDDAGMARTLVRLASDRDLLHRLASHARLHRPVQGWRTTLAAAQAEYARAAALAG
ncbi:MAG: glycosyltransferase family 4 protein [Actinomycetales bacterium]|nr:glycosyltransferase family 4 protein [Actinomycetales bacterium]